MTDIEISETASLSEMREALVEMTRRINLVTSARVVNTGTEISPVFDFSDSEMTLTLPSLTT